MSLEYKLFLCQKPQIDELTKGDPDDDDYPLWANELERDGDTWYLGGMMFSIEEYHPRENDELVDQPFRDKIKWVLDASGRHRGDSWDDWISFVEAVCKRWDGALYTQQTDSLEWYGPSSTTRPSSTILVWRAPPESEQAPRKKAPVERESDLPKTREQFAALIDRAPNDEASMRLLQRSWTHFEPQFFRENFPPLLLERARAGASLEPWEWVIGRGLGHIEPQLLEAPELKDQKKREQFAARGTLAKAIAERWETLQEYEAERNRLAAEERKKRLEAQKELDRQTVLMLEKRRRAGELYAGLPDDIRKLIKAGQLDKAAVEYARRYELSRAQARKVINANLK